MRMDNTYFVYMLLCDDGTYYTGVTHDTERRAAEHNEGLNPRCYTYTRRPVRLVFSSQFKEIDDAIRFEKQLKGWSRKKKAALIRGDWGAIVTMAREIRPAKR
jgi:putative endonuclease